MRREGVLNGTMKTRESPPPVHVHVPGTSPVHVYMRRSPRKTPQTRMSDPVVKDTRGESKGRAPWIPPGKVSSWRNTDSARNQRGRLQRQTENGHCQDREGTEEKTVSVSRNLSVLLKEQENKPCLKRSASGDRDTATLLRVLVEAEIDGVAVTSQLTSLKETVDCLAKDKRVPKFHASSLGRQQKLLLERIEMFDSTNRSLRELLRDWMNHERELLMWTEQKDTLMTRLSESQTKNIQLLSKLGSKEKEASKLAAHLDIEKVNLKSTEERSNFLESSRLHLESQLSRANDENAELTAQIQRIQRIQGQRQEELQSLRNQKEEEEQQRREQEELARQLTEKLNEKDSQLAHALSVSSDWCFRHSKEAAARGLMEDEVSALKLKVSDLVSQLHSAEEKSRAGREELRDQLQNLNTENTSTQMDNHRLQGQLATSEETLRALQTEARQLKVTIRKHETLVEKYQKKMREARLESEESRLKLEASQKEARDVKVSLEKEKEQLRRELLRRIRELEMLPDRLRRTEQELRDAQQGTHSHERRNLEHNAALAEVRQKVEQQGAELETVLQRNLLLQDENNSVTKKMQLLERRLEEMRVEHKNLSQAVAVKENTNCKLQQQLEEKSHECSVLSRQLQQSLDDAERQSMHKALAKERASQSKALDLQSQLSRARAELSQMQRSKEEMERRLENQLQNLQDRLEQSESTNRALQNYVHFLKTSYGKVFSDVLLPI